MTSKSYNFRKYNRENDEEVLRISPTDLGKCPLILYRKKTQQYTYEYTDKTRTLFAKGNEIHYIEALNRKDAKNLNMADCHMEIYCADKKIAFTGYSDFIMMDQFGMYIEDLKTCNIGAFIYFLNEVGGMSERLQLGGYRLLFNVVYGFDIPRCVITKIDRDNVLNRLSLQVDTLSPDKMELFILEHPTVKLILEEIEYDEFTEYVKLFIKQNDWICNYCSEKKECDIYQTLNKPKKTSAPKKQQKI